MLRVQKIIDIVCFLKKGDYFFYNVPHPPPNKICFQKLILFSDMTYHGWHRLLEVVAHSASSGLYTIGKMPECLRKAKIQHRKREKWLVCTQSEHTWFVSPMPLALPFKRLFGVNCPSQQHLQVIEELRLRSVSHPCLLDVWKNLSINPLEYSSRILMFLCGVCVSLFGFIIFFPVFHCLNSQRHQSSRAFSLIIFVFQQQVIGLWPVPKPSFNDSILDSGRHHFPCHWPGLQ